MFTVISFNSIMPVVQIVLANKISTLRSSIYKTEAYWLLRSYEVLELLFVIDQKVVTTTFPTPVSTPAAVASINKACQAKPWPCCSKPADDSLILIAVDN
jgi:hypothetical protein